MVKKNKNRQTQESSTAQNGGDSAESCDQKKTCSTGSKCPHIPKSVHLASIKRALKNGCLVEDCPGCFKDGVKIDKEEGAKGTGLWLCLQCGHQGCGRTENEHALKHFRVVHSDPHCLAVNTTTWNVWCYTCEVELDSEHRKRLHECVKYLKNLDCPSSVRSSTKSCSRERDKTMETESPPMPLSDVTNMPHGVRTPKKKMLILPRVRGLQNLGNTCFFNSVMQCLAQTPHLLELLQDTQQGGTHFCLPGGKGLLKQSTEEQKGAVQDDSDDEDLPPLEGKLTKWGTLTETLASTLEELQLDDASVVNPQRLFNKFTAKCPQFGGGDQNDAHELLRHLLEEVRTEDLKRYWTAILDQYGLSRHDTNETVDGDVRARVRAYGRQASDLLQLPDPVFRGILVSTVECQDCLRSNQRTEPFYELSLPVTSNKPQPPVMRRKTGGEDSFDVCGNTTSEMPSKHQLKKERRQQRKGRKKQQQQPKGARVLDLSNGEPSIAEEGNNAAESEQSDADIEDNVEQDIALKVARTVVNGEVVPSLELNSSNSNSAENRINQLLAEKVRKRKEAIKNRDLVSLPNEKLCNGIDCESSSVGENRAIEENGVDFHTTCNDLVSKKSVTDTKRVYLQTNVNKFENSEKKEESGGMEGVKESAMKRNDNKNIKKNECAQDNSVNLEDQTINNNFADEGSPCIKESKIAVAKDMMLNGVVEETGSIHDEIVENRMIKENGICEEISFVNESICSVDESSVSHDLSFQLTNDNTCKEGAIQELSLSIPMAINSPSAMGSPVSNTGTPSSVSSDLNVDLNITNHLPANNWHIEDTDRPFSRIAFCNDDDPVTSNNNNQTQLTPINKNSPSGCVSKTCGESGCKENSTGDVLAKEMAGLSLGHDERQSPSHWDTCSAHSLEDLKESESVLPLEIPMCNGISKCSELEHVNDGDKSATMAPRYHCGDKECSVESCLNQFTLLELMTGSCKVICESCSERVNKGKEGKMVATNSTKQYLVSNPPAVLVLHLKRFEVHQNMFRKTARHVSFPMMLDIAPICNAKCRELPTIRKGQTQVLYSLYGVVQHSGTLHGGHYSAYVKVRAPVKRDDMRWCFLPTTETSQRLDELSKGVSIPTEPVPGKWYHVSDSRVNEVNEDRVLLSQAYLLFYERVW